MLLRLFLVAWEISLKNRKLLCCIRSAILVLAIFNFSSFVFAEPTSQLREEFSNLGSQIEELKLDLLSSNLKNLTSSDAGIALLRLDAIESKLRAAVGRLEALEYNFLIVSKEAGKRLQEFEIRLIELESNSDDELNVGKIGKPIDLLEPVEMKNNSAEDIIFMKAIDNFQLRKFSEATHKLRTFIERYPFSTRYAEANFLLGSSFFEINEYDSAANAYLDSFVADPSGENAPRSLVGLAVSLEQINQSEQACLTLKEAKARYSVEVKKILDDMDKDKKLSKCN